MERLDRDPLFVALTRPQMALGVPYVYLVLNSILPTELFLVAKSAWVLLAAAVVHLVGVAISAEEPRAFDLWRLKVMLTPPVPNQRYWRCNSYRP